MARTTKKCPSCGEQSLKEKLHPGRVLVGVVVTVVCGLLAVPTLGISLIFMLWGVMFMVKRPTCTSCGWRKGQNEPQRLARR